jgi:hypothetical protein
VIRGLAVVGMALALAPSASAALPNPCTLLTNAEVAKALGSRVQNRTTQLPPAMQSTTRFRICTWTGAPLSSYRSSGDTLRLIILPSTRSQFLKAAKQSDGAVRVQNLGDTAYATGQSLNLLAHGYSLSIWLSSVDARQAETVLAHAAVKRL